jgi:hypothetical protein
MSDLSSKLPPELWAHIFRLTTDIPGLLDVSPLSTTEILPRSWIEYDIDGSSLRRRAVRDIQWSALMKSVLVLVCRYWRSVAASLLYEYIALSSYASAYQLERTLSDNIADGTVPPLGSFIKLLDISLVQSEHTDANARRSSPFPFILSRCRNLQIVTFWSDADSRSQINEHYPSTILDRISSPLLQLDWSSKHRSTLLFVMRLRHFEQLQVLSLAFDNELDYSLQRSVVSLPHLHTMQLYDGDAAEYITWLSTWQLPMLQRLLLCCPEGHISHLVPLLKESGSQITYLNVIDMTQDAPSNISAILQSCPQLQHLLIPNFALVKPIASPHSSLIKVTFETKIRKSRAAQPALDTELLNSELGMLKENITTLIEWRSSVLCRVRLKRFKRSLLEQVRASAEVAALWLETFNMSRSAGLRLEYDNGDLIEMPN